MPTGVYKRNPDAEEKRKNAARLAVRTPEHREKLSRLAKENDYGKWMRGKKHSAKTIKKMKEGRFGENGSSWAGGRQVTKEGYILVHTGEHHENKHKRYIREHILVMEKHLGRKLIKGEVVHHINGNPSDNRIENLQLCASQSAHMKLHYPKGKSINSRSNKE